MYSFYQRHKPGVWTVGIIVLLGIISYVYAGVLDSRSLNSSISSGAPNSMQTQQFSPQSAGDAARENTGADNNADISVEDRKVIRNGSLELIVGDVKRFADEVTSLTNRVGGFVANSRITDRNQDDQSAVSGSLTIRVPADTFQQSINQLKELAIRAADERTSARDVTERLTDLEARLRNARRTEQQYLRIFEQAGDIDDILQVQERISDIRERIERLEANQQQLQEQVQMATIDIELIAEEDIKIAGISWKPLNEIKTNFNEMVTQVTNFVNMLISVVFALPILALWLAFILLILAGLWHGGWWVKGRLFD